MAVTFGTAVVNGYNTNSGYTLSLSGVTSGQPIVLMHTTVFTSADLTGISDNFSTPYTWTEVQQVTWSPTPCRLDLWIGTGGAGTSGTITIVCPGGAGTGGTILNAGSAVPCIGASTAAGLAAIDVSGQTFVQTQNTPYSNLSPSLTPSVAGEGAVMVDHSNYPVTYPSSPWSNTMIATGGSNYGGLSCQGNLTQGTPYQAAWPCNTNTIIGWATAGCLILPPSTAVPNSQVEPRIVLQAVNRSSFF